MPRRLTDEEFADIHIIRQDYAKAKNRAGANPSEENMAAYHEQYARRGRAIRSLHRDDNFGVRSLAAMFRCSKEFVRAALEEETE